MAYVAKSQKVWSEIEHNINKMFREREVHAAEWRTYCDLKVLGMQCYRVLCSEEQERAIQNIPKGWLKRQKEFTFKVRVRCPTSLEGSKIIILKESFEVKFDTKYPWPSHYTYYNDDHIISEDDVSEDISKVVIRRNKQMRAVAENKAAMIAGAKDLYNKSKSINQFVKLWEPALGLLCEDVIERLRKKTVRNASAEDQGISQEALDALNSQYVKAKVSQ
jgi:peptide methionine sulfoxide reductase MsrB